MKLNDLTPGRPVEISVYKNNTEKSEDNIFISSLFDITNSGDVVIHMPSRQGKYVALPLNIQYAVVIYTNVGIYQFVGTITRQGKLEKFPVYVIRPDTQLKKIQRREFYRFPCSIPTNVVSVPGEFVELPNMDLIDEKVNSLSNEIKRNIGTIVNISGGGAKIHATHNLCLDEFMSLSFVLETPKTTFRFNLLARSVNSEYNKNLGIYENRVEFIFKDSEDREVIIKYIFDEDRRLRKKNQG